MLNQPKKTKYRKCFKLRNLPKTSTHAHKLGEKTCFAVIASQPGYLNTQQIEAARQTIRRKVKREGKLEIPLFPNIPITKKASAARMGKGKGKVDHWVVSLAAGRTVFLLYGIEPKQGLPALRSGVNKLPIKLKIYQL
uniref:ribosomal protein L16 n=1 Tax=Scytothamnus australis TaxID=66621 RepID=UPI002E76AB40|nr:ribosomal protein L16 [Scytothamnus australis]WBP70299.1 ribosomal protein L16 [Scytothamnus australis]